jgi:hypothetical protein
LGPAELYELADGWRAKKTIGKAPKPRRAGSTFLDVLLGSIVFCPGRRRPQDALAICLQQQFATMREIAAVVQFGIGCVLSHQAMPQTLVEVLRVELVLSLEILPSHGLMAVCRIVTWLRERQHEVRSLPQRSSRYSRSLGRRCSSYRVIIVFAPFDLDAMRCCDLLQELDAEAAP